MNLIDITEGDFVMFDDDNIELVLWKGSNRQVLVTAYNKYSPHWRDYTSIVSVICHLELNQFASKSEITKLNEKLIALEKSNHEYINTNNQLLQTLSDLQDDTRTKLDRHEVELKHFEQNRQTLVKLIKGYRAMLNAAITLLGEWPNIV